MWLPGTCQSNAQSKKRAIVFVNQCFVNFEDEQDFLIQFQQMQKKHMIDPRKHLERYCDLLPVFAFNSPKNDVNLMKLFLLPFPVNELFMS